GLYFLEAGGGTSDQCGHGFCFGWSLLRSLLHCMAWCGGGLVWYGSGRHVCCGQASQDLAIASGFSALYWGGVRLSTEWFLAGAGCKTHYKTVRRNFRCSQPDHAEKVTAIKKSARCRSRRKRALEVRSGNRLALRAAKRGLTVGVKRAKAIYAHRIQGHQ
ncbi:hypothetical protein AMECASPLE_022676, partial [Ameca splendens]